MWDQISEFLFDYNTVAGIQFENWMWLIGVPVQTAKEIAVLRGHDGLVLSAAFSPDGSRIVTASTEHNASLDNLVGDDAQSQHSPNAPFARLEMLTTEPDGGLQRYQRRLDAFRSRVRTTLVTLQCGRQSRTLCR